MAFLALLSGCATAKGVECKAHGGAAWTRVESPNFAVRTSLPEDQAREVTRTLEQSLRAVLWAVDYDVDLERIDAVIVGDGQLEPFGYDVDGFTPSGARMLTQAHEGVIQGTRPGIVLIQLANIVTDWAHPAMPGWFKKGFGHWLNAANFSDRQTVKLGTGVNSYAKTIWLKGPMPMETLWSWGMSEAKPTRDERLYYAATCWAIVHYLANHEREKFLELLRAFKTHEPAEASFARIFPRFVEEQLPALRKHVDGGKFSAVNLRLPEGPPAITTSELGPVAVHLVRKELAEHATLLEGPAKKERMEHELAAARTVADPAELDGALALFDADLLDEPALLERHGKVARVLRAIALRRPVGSPRAVERVRDALAANPEDAALQARLLVEDGLGPDAPAALDTLEAEAATAPPLSVIAAAMISLARQDWSRVAKFAEALKGRGAVPVADMPLSLWAKLLLSAATPPVPAASLACVSKDETARAQLQRQARQVLRPSLDALTRLFVRFDRALESTSASSASRFTYSFKLLPDGTLDANPTAAVGNPLHQRGLRVITARLGTLTPCPD